MSEIITNFHFKSGEKKDYSSRLSYFTLNRNILHLFPQTVSYSHLIVRETFRH
jgi:hypothetical protein